MAEWVEVGIMPVKDDWQIIDNPFVGGELFRLTHDYSEEPSGYCLVVSEYTGAGKYGYERIYPTPSSDNLIHLPVPAFLWQLGFTRRRLALKASFRANYFERDWLVKIERWTGESMAGNGGGSVSQENTESFAALQNQVQTLADSVVLLDSTVIDLVNRLEALELDSGSASVDVDLDLIAEQVIDRAGLRQSSGELKKIKDVIPPQTTLTFYVRNGGFEGNSGMSETEAFSSIEEAVIVLSESYEVAGQLIIELDDVHTLRCTEFPRFSGSGTIILRGPESGCQVTFVAFEGSTVTDFANWAALDFNIENVTFVKGDNTKFNIQGGKIFFTNVDFGACDLEFDACRQSAFTECKNSNRIRIYRSNFDLFNCKFQIELFYSQVFAQNCEFLRAFICEACSILLQNPRFNFFYYTQTARIVNSTIEFKRSWLTFTNLGSPPQTRSLIEFQSTNIKDFPSNVDVQGNRRFLNCSILKFVNCQAPQEFPNVSYNFSRHRFEGEGNAIALYNTAFLKQLSITGGEIFLDPFSVFGEQNYDNSESGLTSINNQQAIDELTNRIKALEP